MPVYVVSFEVQDGGSVDQLPALRKAIAKLKGHQVLQSSYLVNAPFTAGALKQYLLNHMGEKDRICVSKLPRRADLEFSFHGIGGTNAWLRKNSRMELPVPANSSNGGQVAIGD
ncbi:hypothetical protein LZ016_07770 [Sphingomonas sp. SM33]|uniref:Uncharacterized protein n=1 Tax=Sphingomonas telluris TaxID=2907998 RepID=A0ABS9VM04_9SPHN|nr:hypothetical protein [Sphingomonas telluris]MCH8615995.1 hypothetical protein [Sphingomonas telluris]